MNHIMILLRSVLVCTLGVRKNQTSAERTMPFLTRVGFRVYAWSSVPRAYMKSERSVRTKLERMCQRGEERAFAACSAMACRITSTAFCPT